MIRIPSVPAGLDTDEQDWRRAAAEILRVPVRNITACRLARRAVDARRRQDIHLVLTLDISLNGDEAAAVRACRRPGVSLLQTSAPAVIAAMPRPPARPPVVVGSGPAGLFAALTLARAGARPLLLERGKAVEARRTDVEAFWAGGALNAASNVQFGEGGAGTFSDGKLTTGIKSPYCAQVLQTFARLGAPEEILWQAMPHIGTDRLVHVVRAMREEIESLGGQVLFQTRLAGLRVEDGALRGIRTDGAEIETDALLLCIGHSARDTFEMLHDAGIAMQAKPFSMGVRIEHPQAMIDRAQYGGFAGHPALGAAPYKLSARLPNGRGAYTFCMCPGGTVVAAASQEGCLVTNGMSVYARDGQNANSALLADVRAEDFDGDDPLAGLRFQERWERRAYAAGGNAYRAPGQRVEDFLAGRPTRAFGDVLPTYRPGVTPADLRDCLPAFVAESLAAAIGRFDGMLRGFALGDAVLTGVETRSSSAVRIPRGVDGQASICGIYPVGEGAGYAGGIMSAAVDGIRAAAHAIDFLKSQD